MRELFQFLLETIDKQRQSGGNLEIVYDETMGFPKRVFIDIDSGIHSAVSIEVWNVVFAEE